MAVRSLFFLLLFVQRCSIVMQWKAIAFVWFHLHWINWSVYRNVQSLNRPPLAGYRCWFDKSMHRKSVCAFMFALVLETRFALWWRFHKLNHILIPWRPIVFFFLHQFSSTLFFCVVCRWCYASFFQVFSSICAASVHRRHCCQNRCRPIKFPKNVQNNNTAKKKPS